MGLARSLPELNVAYYLQSDLPFSDNSNFNIIFSEIKNNTSIKKVVLAALWSRRVADLNNEIDVTKKLINTFDALKDSGKMVFIADNIPWFPFSPNRCAQIRKFPSRNSICDVDLSDVRVKSKRFRESLTQALASAPYVNFIDVERHFCSESVCRMEKDGLLLYRDSRHLNINGSLLLGDLIVRENPLLSHD